MKIKIKFPRMKLPGKILWSVCVAGLSAWALYAFVPARLWLPATGLILLLIYWSGQSRKYAAAKSVTDRWQARANHTWSSPDRSVQPSVFVWGARKPLQRDEITELEEKKKKELEAAQAET